MTPEPELRVRDAMEPNPITVAHDAALSAAVALMDRYEVRHLPVVRGETLVGVLSDRDLLESTGWLVAHADDELHHEPAVVLDAMQPEPVTALPEDPLAAAAGTMAEWGVGCLPVARGRALVGLLTATDVLDVFADSSRYGRASEEADPRVEKAMTADVVTIDPTATLAQAAALMREGDFRHLPVVVDGVAIGIVSDRDLRTARGRGESDDARVANAMSADVVTVSPGARLSRAARRMADRRVGALPVEDERGVMIGMLTITDVLMHYAERREAGSGA